jgi:hypothetical protein
VHTLEDDTKRAFADFLSHSVVDANDVLGRTGAAVGVPGHVEGDEEERRGRGKGEEKGKRTRGKRNMNTQVTLSWSKRFSLGVIRDTHAFSISSLTMPTIQLQQY